MDNKRETKKQKQETINKIIKHLIINIHFGGVIDDKLFFIDNKKTPKIRDMNGKIILNIDNKNIIDKCDERIEYLESYETLNKHYIKQVNEYMILFYCIKGFIKPISDELYKIININCEKKNKKTYEPTLWRYNSFLYSNEGFLERLIDTEDDENKSIFINQLKQIKNFKEYCNPFIKKKYNKLLDRYFYKDMKNIITDYLL